MYVGFLADWNKIFNDGSGGGGEYYFEITRVIMGVTTIDESIRYKLMLYSDCAANGTVRIETYNTGTILSSDFDYTDLLTNGWYQSFRIAGRLMPKIPKLITDNYLSAGYERLQIQDKIENEWELILNPIPAEVSNKIIYDNLLANKIYISDYNLYSEENIKQKEFYCIDIPNKKPFERNRKSSFTIKFTEKLNNIIKNNW
jgi:hypothetical protein